MSKDKIAAFVEAHLTDKVIDNVMAQVEGMTNGDSPKSPIDADGNSRITGRAIRKPLFWESMTCVHDPNSGARIRVWRDEPECPEYVDEEIILTIQQMPLSSSMKEMVDTIGSLERVTAVEAVDKNGYGGIAYYDWELKHRE